MTVLAAWWEGRTEREKRLVALSALLALVAVAASAGLRCRDGFARLSARVETHEQELATVRRLALELSGSARPVPASSEPIAARVEAIAVAQVGRERLTSLARSSEGSETVSFRLADVTLAETVQILHDLDAVAPSCVVVRMDLRRHVDDAKRFDFVADVAPPS